MQPTECFYFQFTLCHMKTFFIVSCMDVYDAILYSSVQQQLNVLFSETILCCKRSYSIMPFMTVYNRYRERMVCP